MFAAQQLDEPVLADLSAYRQGLHQNGHDRGLIRTRRLHYSKSVFSGAAPGKGLRARRLPLATRNDQKRVKMVPPGAIFVDAQSRRRQATFHAQKNFTSPLDENTGITPDQSALGT
jgi:hypothetical protein